MLFDFNANRSQLRWQLVKQQQRLAMIAMKPIHEATGLRDQLLEEVESLVYCGCLDSLNGGFYQSMDAGLGSHKLDSFNNLILAEFLVGAEKVLLDGRFRFLALQLLNNLQKQMFDEQHGQLQPAITYPPNQLPFSLAYSALAAQLTHAQLELLHALLGLGQVEADSKVIVSFRCSLREAASIAKMHYKQAQIEESQLRETLMVLCRKQYATPGFSASPDFQLMARALICYSHFYLWFPGAGELEVPEAIASRIETRLSGLIQKEVTADPADPWMALSLLEWLQVSPNQERASLVAQYLQLMGSDRPLRIALSNQVSTDLGIVLRQAKAALTELADMQDIDTTHWSQDESQTLSLPAWRCRLLPKTAAGIQERDRLLAGYDPNLRIFWRA